MKQVTALGIDAGGTHTDAVICERGRVLVRSKVATDHADLPGTVGRALDALLGEGGKEALERVGRVTIGTTLLVNAAVQGRLDRVGLGLSAGPGLSPLRFCLGEDVCVVPGGLDHRGVEVEKLDLAPLREACERWKKDGIGAFAFVGKFSPRNPDHELAMEGALGDGCNVTLGHRISGELNYPRRIATAYYNAAAMRLHAAFLDAVEEVLGRRGIAAPVFLLKADGGSVPLSASRALPVQSILSGPAASVMGILALGKGLERGCSLLLDMGGTTTDLALLVDGSAVTDRGGMSLQGRRTLVRSLATRSIAAGGDSKLFVESGPEGAVVHAGPLREGFAMAFGGEAPTLLDALNVLNRADGEDGLAGDVDASVRGIESLAASSGMEPLDLARKAWDDAAGNILRAVAALLEEINSHPIYTLRELKGHMDLAPERGFLVGGPAPCLRGRLAKRLSLALSIPEEADVANAVGAALTLPTDSLDVYADSGRAELRAPSLDVKETLSRGSGLDAVKKRGLELLSASMEAKGVSDAPLEVVEADLFVTLDDSGRGAKDMRVRCQAVPGILGRIGQDWAEA